MLGGQVGDLRDCCHVEGPQAGWSTHVRLNLPRCESLPA